MTFNKTASVGVDDKGRHIAVHRITRQLYANSVPVTGAVIEYIHTDRVGHETKRSQTYVSGQKNIPGVLSHTHAPTVVYPPHNHGRVWGKHRRIHV